jgi:hypothetical protein
VNRATITILDDERPAVSIVVGDGTASEAGPDPGVFVVSRTGPTTAALTVTFTVTGAATEGADYARLGGTVTIPAGASSGSITIVPIDDSLVEGAESVVLTLEPSAPYVVVTPGIAVLTIADNDLGAVTIEATDPTASEVGPTPGAFTFRRTGETSAPMTVIVSRGGTATNGTDYAAIGGPSFAVTIPAGQANTTLTLVPFADNVVEGDETVELTLQPGLEYVVGTPAAATVTIGDDPVRVSIVASDAGAAESGLDPGAFLLTRGGGNTSAALTVAVSVSGTAVANRDYVVISGVATIPAGQTAVAIPVTVLPDNLLEGDETVALTIVPGTGTAYLVGSPSSAQVTIADDPPVVNVTVADPTAAEAGLDPATVIFARSGGDLTAPLNVFFNKTGTATNAADYQSLGGAVSLVTIPAGQLSATVTIAPLADNFVEGPETAILTLVPNAGYAIGSAADATVTIADDPPVVSVVATDPDAAEAGADRGIFTFTRSGGNLAAALTVGFTRTGTATNVSDFVTIVSSVTIAAGQASATITITPIDDAIVEGAETVILTVNGSSTVVVGPLASATVTIADND